jgi:hypothetical protein
LDALLESHLCLEGASIKSCVAITARGTTSPTALNRAEQSAEVSKLLSGLTDGEAREVDQYYAWRGLADLATQKASDARREVKNRGKRRTLKSGMKEIERKWREGRKKPR